MSLLDDVNRRIENTQKELVLAYTMKDNIDEVQLVGERLVAEFVNLGYGDWSEDEDPDSPDLYYSFICYSWSNYVNVTVRITEGVDYDYFSLMSPHIGQREVICNPDTPISIVGNGGDGATLTYTKIETRELDDVKFNIVLQVETSVPRRQLEVMLGSGKVKMDTTRTAYTSVYCAV
jgi:hypothetical protein